MCYAPDLLCVCGTVAWYVRSRLLQRFHGRPGRGGSVRIDLLLAAHERRQVRAVAFTRARGQKEQGQPRNFVAATKS